MAKTPKSTPVFVNKPGWVWDGIAIPLKKYGPSLAEQDAPAKAVAKVCAEVARKLTG